MLTILIPMAGAGSRFAKCHYQQAKPFINLDGKPMIEWVLANLLENVNLPQSTQLIFLLREEHLSFFPLLQEIVNGYQPFIKVSYRSVPAVTEGAACTTLIAEQTEGSLLIVNSDQYLEWDAQDYFHTLQERKDDGNIVTFFCQNDPKWSYLQMENGHVTQIREKEPISTEASVGIYFWREARDYFTFAKEMIQKNIRVNNEFYVAPVYNQAIAQGKQFSFYQVKEMHSLGVPADLTNFCYNVIRPKKQRFLSDLPTKYPLHFIAHRGNILGPSAKENQPDYLLEAAEHFDVEVDIWYHQNQWWTGHDQPEYPVSLEFLQHPRFWLHCKSIATLQKITQEYPKGHYFFHQTDNATLTSRGLIWTYPGQEVGLHSVAVALTPDEVKRVSKKCQIVCSDYPIYFGEVARFPFSKRSKALIFDLDGVLIESKDLHYQTFNQAIAEVAGEKYLLEYEEHLALYDGLSTRQKLAKMSLLKQLPIETHDKIFSRKQELSSGAFASLPINQNVAITLQKLKAAGFCLGVASNCIRSSIFLLLKRIGILNEIDLILSNEDVSKAKPDGEIYAKAASCFGCLPSEVIAIEDSKKGFEAVRRAGLELIQVSSPKDITLSFLLPKIFAIEAKYKKLKYIFPLAKRTTSFWISGNEALPTEIPLQLADIQGKPLLSHAIENLQSEHPNKEYSFMVQKNIRMKYSLDSTLIASTKYAATEIISVTTDQLGAAATVNLTKLGDNDSVLISDGSHIIEWPTAGGLEDFFLFVRKKSALAGVIVHYDTDSRWSYIEQDGNDLDRVKMIHEKNPVSSLACAGTYYWYSSVNIANTIKYLLGQEPKRKIFISDVLNVEIRLGHRVVYYPVKKVWSLRSLEEIQLYANSRLTWNFNQENRALSQKKRAAFLQKQNILSLEEKKCWAAYVLCENNFLPTHQLYYLQDSLRRILQKKAVVFDSLHWTFMQLIKFDLEGKVHVPEDYATIVAGIIANTLPLLTIQFHLMTFTPEGCILLGTPSKDVNQAREEVRRELRQIDYPCYEPYRSSLVHMTLARFTSPLNEQEINDLLILEKKVEHASFGTLNVTEVDISQGTYLMKKGDLKDVVRVKLN